jgi:uncharacterized damage-inducible protein DinB
MTSRVLLLAAAIYGHALQSGVDALSKEARADYSIYAKAPPFQQVTGKEAIINSLRESFTYCSDVIEGLADPQLNTSHPSPDGTLRGREILLALYVHVVHHRGQAEVYLRDKGIKPPSFIF